MKNLKSFTALTVVALLTASFSLFAQRPGALKAGNVARASVDYYLKIDGVDGESKAKGQEKWIELESWSWGETNSSTHTAPPVPSAKSVEHAASAGSGAGKVVMHDFHFTMKVNKASPKLMLACATGEHIKEAVLTCRKAGKDQQEYLVIKMTDLLITSFQTSGHGGDIVPIDSFTLNFSKIEFSYKYKNGTEKVVYKGQK